MMVVAGHFTDRAALEQLLVLRLSLLEPFGSHSLRRPDRIGRVGREGEVEWPELGAEEPAGRESLQLFLLAVAFEPLADVDEGRQDGVVRPADAGNPRPNVWA